MGYGSLNAGYAPAVRAACAYVENTLLKMCSACNSGEGGSSNGGAELRPPNWMPCFYALRRGHKNRLGIFIAMGACIPAFREP